MYALDTNLLVYAHNLRSPFHAQAKTFIETVINERDNSGNLNVCIPAQALIEFLNVITWAKLESPLALPEAIALVRQYINTGVQIIQPQASQLQTVLELLENSTTRKKIFDTALAATLKDNGVQGLYTVNVRDFEGFPFLVVINPLV